MSISARKTAVEALLRVDENSGYSNIVLDKALKSSKLDQRDSAFCSALFYGTLEKRLQLDYIIGCYSSVPINKIDTYVKETLRCALYQLLYMDKVPDSAAVNEAVECAKALCGKRVSGFVNGVLRSFIRDEKKIKMPNDPIEEKSIRYSCPKWLIGHFEKSYGEDTANAFFESLSVHSHIFLRVNTTKISEDDLIGLLTDEGLSVRSTFLENAVEVLSGNPVGIKPFDDGLYHIQDISSQLACSLLPVKCGDTVCDVCAAPGGKSYTIAELMENRGNVFSYDLYKGKIGLIKSGAERLGLSCIQAQIRDAKGSTPLPISDAVICDAPCSGLGIIRRKPEIRYKSWEELKDLPSLQYDILKNSSLGVKNGGYFMYSTCTLSPEENGDVVNKFLSENDDFLPVPLLLPDNVKRTVTEPDNQITLFPHKNGTDGFFVALMRKKL